MALIPDRTMTSRNVLRFKDGKLESEVEAHLAVEEPLELRVAGEAVAVTMRTPGDDARLALGFLYAEGIIRGPADVGTVAHCGRTGEEGYGNVIELTPASGANLELDRVQASRRGTLTTSACGVCGRRSVADLLELCGPIPAGAPIPLALVTRSIELLCDVQRVFARTGGSHAAAVLSAEGELLAAFEDVGRHNAVDKVVGALVLRGLSAARNGALGTPPEGPAPALLAVTGRASFEIVQKAAMARIPVVACVSAATSLAAQLADRLNLGLATFVRQGQLEVTSGAHRFEPGA